MQQVTQAYVVLLSSQFQRFCRDLHSEAVHSLAHQPGLGPLFPILRDRLIEGRKLDHGNPNAGNIGSDFGRFSLDFWERTRRLDRRNAARQSKLDELNRWRNAVAHQDFTSAALGGRIQPRFSDVRAWRSACEALAVAFDEVMRVYLQGVLGIAPW